MMRKRDARDVDMPRAMRACPPMLNDAADDANATPPDSDA